ncbi:hypothetical protein NDK47_11085 [Brevibacillus ruminantium]|uniref:Uncharacterized protein n=1 Tax=Brevibacillus ruminantium TaxID=2950604 RepID=A0ABY4WNQ8_9BACL|nr:hypothetical protein [Brevibacillus ruminantium]USG67778.1 hypothetical protein NDK47_11085 [Brevibacillus ruminantium]
MVCREKLLKNIQSVRAAVVSYANCLCEDAPAKDQEVFYQFGLELSHQLMELRKLYVRLYDVNPLSGHNPISITRCSDH